MFVFVSVKQSQRPRARKHETQIRVSDKFSGLMEYEKNSMYPSSNDNLCGGSPTLMSQDPLELQDEVMDSTPQRQRHIDKVVPRLSKEDSEAKKRRHRLRIWSYHCQVLQQKHTNEECREEAEDRQQRLRTWRYHCHVPDAAVNRKSKLTEAAKLLSAEEMQRLNEDIFNPLDICWIISKNSEIPVKN